MRLWDLAAGKTRATLTHHKRGIRAVACAPFDGSFVSAAADAVRTWRRKDGELLRTMRGGQRRAERLRRQLRGRARDGRRRRLAAPLGLPDRVQLPAARDRRAARLAGLRRASTTRAFDRLRHAAHHVRGGQDGEDLEGAGRGGPGEPPFEQVETKGSSSSASTSPTSGCRHTSTLPSSRPSRRFTSAPRFGGTRSTSATTRRASRCSPARRGRRRACAGAAIPLVPATARPAARRGAGCSLFALLDERRWAPFSRISAATNASAVNAPGNRTGPAVARAASIRPSARARRSSRTKRRLRSSRGPAARPSSRPQRRRDPSTSPTTRPRCSTTAAGSRACIV